MECNCPVTRNRVSISDHIEDHIIDRHFNPSPNDEWEPRRGFFFRHIFARPEDLFHEVLDRLRTNLQPGEKSGNCYVYHLEFADEVGYFPYRLGGPCYTKFVRVVCTYIICRICSRHCPSSVVTAYPED